MVAAEGLPTPPYALGDPNRGAYRFVKAAFVNHGVKSLALFGYSHGGGSVWLLSAMLDRVINHDGGQVIGHEGLGNLAADPDFKAKWNQGHGLVWTGYIDAINVQSAQGETRLPYLTKNHFNRYEDDPDAMDFPVNGNKTTLDSDGVPGWNPPLAPQFILDQNNTDRADDPNLAYGGNPYPDEWKPNLWPGKLTHGSIDIDGQVRQQLVKALEWVLTKSFNIF